MTEHIVAVFNTEAAAEAAIQDLRAAGFLSSAIRHYRPDGSEGGATVSHAGSGEATSSMGGFWAWLLGEESPQTTRSSYPHHEEWYSRRATYGHTVLSVQVDDDSRIHLAAEILERQHPLEMEESTEEAEARLHSASGDPIASSSSSVQRNEHTGTGIHGKSPGTSAATGAEEVIPLAEEDLQVGKHVIDRGTTRIRRYVVETPVERDITLQGERVTIERRRPTDTTVVGHAFEERTVEVHETEEVPVIEKTARVTEEVAVRRDATERTETVRDTVRREEVDVTNNKGKPSSRP